MIVEFIGTPGAGKTTLLPAVSEHFIAQGFDPYSVVEAARPFARRTLPGRAVYHFAPPVLRGPLLWQLFYHTSKLYRAGFFMKNRELVRTVLSFQRSRPISEADRKHVLRWFLHLTGYYQFLRAHSRPADVLLFDEGFVHRVVQLFASEAEEADPERIAAYLDLIPRPDLVIFPYASERNCETRVRDRGVWERFRSKSPAALSRFIATSHAVVSIAVARIEARGWTVIAVDNDGNDPEASKADLKRKLSRLAAHPAGMIPTETEGVNDVRAV